ncbi:hypothetical protein PAXINDRAFT_15174 [Paxillus involutus ATCC 200175]|uniref:Sde2 N-terminal ubiquitin domain-containing protein n=1 Tax=Paxillus involutus ATCC 200175 TaxID=664439 RepID=A0A0C9TXE7_PAXIN|nr:hypothetical protein PAXINDRAFT_15174 [Paxillus involutus ATCC 200175]
MSTSILFSTFPPFPTLSLLVPSGTRINDLYELLCDRYPDLPASETLTISPHSGLLAPDIRVSELHDQSSNLVTLRLVPRLRGGKGGFGSQLRAAGGRMSSQKTNNNDSCRDLSGRRLSTIKTAKRVRSPSPNCAYGYPIVALHSLVDYIENEDERKKAATEAKKGQARQARKEDCSGFGGF